MRILKARFKSSGAFLDAWQADPEPGSLFCATTDELGKDEPVVVDLFFPELPNRVLIRARVAAWRPATPRLRIRAGATVAFDAAERDKMSFVLEVARGNSTPRTRRRHTRLPIDLPTRWRTAESADYRDSGIEEISVGGALLRTPTPLPLGTEVIIEVLSPGAVKPMALAGRVAYHTGRDTTGIRWVARDSGGLRRLRELIRRLKASG